MHYIRCRLFEQSWRHLFRFVARSGGFRNGVRLLDRDLDLVQFFFNRVGVKRKDGFLFGVWLRLLGKDIRLIEETARGLVGIALINRPQWFECLLCAAFFGFGRSGGLRWFHAKTFIGRLFQIDLQKWLGNLRCAAFFCQIEIQPFRHLGFDGDGGGFIGDVHPILISLAGQRGRWLSRTFRAIAGHVSGRALIFEGFFEREFDQGFLSQIDNPIRQGNIVRRCRCLRGGAFGQALGIFGGEQQSQVGLISVRTFRRLRRRAEELCRIHHRAGILFVQQAEERLLIQIGERKFRLRYADRVSAGIFSVFVGARRIRIERRHFGFGRAGLRFGGHLRVARRFDFFEFFQHVGRIGFLAACRGEVRRRMRFGDAAAALLGFFIFRVQPHTVAIIAQRFRIVLLFFVQFADAHQFGRGVFRPGHRIIHPRNFQNQLRVLLI